MLLIKYGRNSSFFALINVIRWIDGLIDQLLTRRLPAIRL